ncbi:MAG: 2-oxoacid:ferredoxin oxidoreductase subunit beta [Candidatus Stahlbacteria bacterium]|nr:2-oxoacid:ferredoxin oxidoreductase subunit beta [Candidatus Stahlbacteria bacterium]
MASGPFCAGCGGGTVLNVFTHAIDELGIDPKDIVSVTGIGCSAWIPSPYYKADTLHTTHGRPIAFATGVKIMKPNMKVIVIAGDGDIAGIGGNHLIHAARRNIDLTVFLINNSIYAMTGGQVAPTTPYGVRATTTPYGNLEPDFDVARLVVSAGASYVARWTTYQVFNLLKSMKEAITKKGFSFIEIVSQCPVSYGKMIGKHRASDFLKTYKESSIPFSRAEKMSEKELKGKIVIGKFVDRDRPEFTESLRRLNKERIIKPTAEATEDTRG